MASSIPIWSSSKTNSRKREKLVKEKRGYCNLISNFITNKDTNSTVLSRTQKTPQQQTATSFLLRKTVSKFELSQYLAELGYLSHRPSGLDEDPFRFVHSKVAAFNSKREELDRSCRELYPKTPAHMQEDMQEEFLSRLEEQEQEREKLKKSGITQWPYLIDDDDSKMNVDQEDVGVVVHESEAQRQKRLISARGVPLSQEELQRVRSILIGPETHEVLIDKYAIDMTRAKILCLRPCTWLNDEVINFYMNMLMERDQRRSDESAGKIRSSHFFSSFFMVKLLQNGRYTYANVKRWTKKFDVFQKDKIFIPVNINNAHWTLLIVYIQKNEIHYYDSMSGRGKEYTKAVMKWLEDESREKKQMDLDSSSWRIFDCENGVPQQQNGFDCGMFTIMCADTITDELPLHIYGQSRMVEYRQKVAAAILRGTVNY